MALKILVFWVVVFLVLGFLTRRPNSILTRAALTWVGPTPIPGQFWSSFQLRWAVYSFGWLCQFAFAFSALLVVATYYPRAPESLWFQVPMFALPLGAGVASLASIGFLAKAAKAHYFGPNPICAHSNNAVQA